jgi:hypothetical protein
VTHNDVAMILPLAHMPLYYGITALHIIKVKDMQIMSENTVEKLLP